MMCPDTICRIRRRTEVGRTVRGEDLGGSCQRNQQDGKLANGLHVERMFLDFWNKKVENVRAASSCLG